MEHGVFGFAVHRLHACVLSAQRRHLGILLFGAQTDTAQAVGIPALLEQGVVQLARDVEHALQPCRLVAGWVGGAAAQCVSLRASIAHADAICLAFTFVRPKEAVRCDVLRWRFRTASTPLPSAHWRPITRPPWRSNGTRDLPPRRRAESTAKRGEAAQRSGSPTAAGVHH